MNVDIDDCVHIAIPGTYGDVQVSIAGCERRIRDMLLKNWRQCHSQAERKIRIELGNPHNQRKVIKIDRDRYCAEGICDYSSMKIAIRGVMSDADIKGTTYFHGCTFITSRLGELRNRFGVLLLGASGSGKTTAVSSLMLDRNREFILINDDWGPFDIDGKWAISTNEPFLHMKLTSIKTFCPALSQDEILQIEEYPDALRGLVSKSRVFPQSACRGKVNLVVILMRDCNQSPGWRSIDADEAMGQLASGTFSSYYGKCERFMNGALLIDSEEQYRKQYINIRHALDGLKFIIINNTSSKKSLVESMYSAMDCMGE